MLRNVQQDYKMITVAPDFDLYNHENIVHRLSNVMGQNGALIGFAGDIWDLNSVRNVLWLQRQAYKLSVAGIKASFIVPNHAHDLSGFFMSIPRTIPFPLLADPDRIVYSQYGIDSTSYVYMNRERAVKQVYRLRHGVQPRLRDIAPIS